MFLSFSSFFLRKREWIYYSTSCLFKKKKKTKKKGKQRKKERQEKTKKQIISDAVQLDNEKKIV